MNYNRVNIFSISMKIQRSLKKFFLIFLLKLNIDSTRKKLEKKNFGLPMLTPF